MFGIIILCCCSGEYYYSSNLEYNWQHELPIQESFLLDAVPLVEYYPTQPYYSTMELEPIPSIVIQDDKFVYNITFIIL